MKRRILLTSVLAALVVIGGSMAPNVNAGTYSCHAATTCPNSASCDGSHYSTSGCTVQCYNGGLQGQLIVAGSASCGGGSGKGGVQNPTP